MAVENQEWGTCVNGSLIVDSKSRSNTHICVEEKIIEKNPLKQSMWSIPYSEIRINNSPCKSCPHYIKSTTLRVTEEYD